MFHAGRIRNRGRTTFSDEDIFFMQKDLFEKYVRPENNLNPLLLK
jgi:hypothetical protein